jgi:hypothetical protein
MLPVSIELIEFNHYTSFVNLFLGWIGISILMHAFPSTGDAKVMISSILKNDEVSKIVKILVSPIIGIIYVGALGSVMWLDLFYAIGISMLLPKILVNIL